jgi:hypothetical protein
VEEVGKVLMFVRIQVSFLFALTLFYPVAAVQDREQMSQRAGMRTAEGALFIWNQPGNNFTLEIKGKDVRPNNSTKDVYFKADGIIIQIQCAATSQFIKAPRQPLRDPETVLIAHRDWESQYVGSFFGHQPNVQSVAQKSSDGRESLYWKLDIPENFKPPGKTRLFLTTINGEYVIVLTSVLMSSEEEQRVRKFMFDTLATLKVSAKPFDVPQPEKESL